MAAKALGRINNPEAFPALRLALRDSEWWVRSNAAHALKAMGSRPAPGTGPPPGDPDRKYRGFRSFEDDAWQLERSQRLRMALFDMHKPIVAQVHGHCLAGGTDIALLCDMIIAADDAIFGFPPARDLGALPNNMWLYNVGPQWAKRLTLTGDTITGAEAAQILVDRAGSR